MKEQIIARNNLYELENKVESLEMSINCLIFKIDRLIERFEGPPFQEARRSIGNLSELTNRNLESLNNMILQVKGIMSQVSSLKGRKPNEWLGDEIQLKPKESIENKRIN